MSWMLVLLMPEEVRRNLKMPPVSISTEETPAAPENHRGEPWPEPSADLVGDGCASPAFRTTGLPLGLSHRPTSGNRRAVTVAGVDAKRVDPVTVPCQKCCVKLAADSPELRLELTCDVEPIVYCLKCWEREFGEC